MSASLQSTTWPSTLKRPGCSKLAVEPTLTVTPAPVGTGRDGHGGGGGGAAALADRLAGGQPASGSPFFGVSLWTIRLMPSASPSGRLRV